MLNNFWQTFFGKSGVNIIFATLGLICLIAAFDPLLIRNNIDRLLPHITPYLGIEERILNSDSYRIRANQQAILLSADQKQAILLIGDSHIQNLEKFSTRENNVINLGISGDTSLGVLERLKKIPNASDPRTIVIFVGYNDLKYREIRGILINIRSAVEYINTNWINIENIIVSGPIPVSEKRTYTNKKLKELGLTLSEFCLFQSCQYFDPSPLFKRGNGIDINLTIDGVHLNDAGSLMLFNALLKENVKGYRIAKNNQTLPR
jgi:lysophospholipase L1-like esterase